MKFGRLPLAIPGALAAQCCLATVACAQDVTTAPTIGTVFDRTRSTAVADRIIPGYEPRGIAVGAFLLSPQIDAGAFAIDNVYANLDNGVKDIAFELAPSLALASQWSQNQLSLTGGETSTRYVSHGSENSDLGQVKAQGRYDLDTHLALYGYGEFRQDEVARTQPGVLQGLKRPLFYNLAGAGTRVTWTSNPVKATVAYDFRSLDYNTIEYNSGFLSPPAGLSRQQATLSASGEYALTSDLALIVLGRAEAIDYKHFDGFPVLDRSSHKAELLFGSSFEFTDFVRGEVAVGFISQRFVASELKNYSGFGGRAKIQLFPTGLTTVEFDLSRTLNEADNPLDSNFTMTAATIKVDHELYRNVILTPSITYSSNNYLQIGRADTQLRIGFSARWMLDRNFTIQAQYQFVHSDTNDFAAGLRFNVNILSLNLTYRI